jgi:hypothetical protein
MKSSEFKKLFTRLRTLRRLVRMKLADLDEDSFIGPVTYEIRHVHIALMTSDYQRVQFTNSMNEVGTILHSMSGGNSQLKNIIILLILYVWRINSYYPDQCHVVSENNTKLKPVWALLLFHSAALSSGDYHEGFGSIIQTLDRILDGSPKDYANQIMLLKLSL